MNMHLTKSQIGLDGVPAAETVLSHVDGERGELIIAGEHVGDLAGKASFESVTARLWSGATGKAFTKPMCAPASARRANAPLPGCPTCCRRPAACRSSTDSAPRSRACAPKAGSIMRRRSSARVRSSRRAGAARQGRRAGRARCDVSHAADTLTMLHDARPEAREVAALDTYFVTVCDHGMNASTFTTRVVASTQADLFAAVTAGYCALTGPLHGGAPEPVLEMLDAIGSRERIKPWVDDALSRGERLMGFGHRVYRVRDPRADVLKAAIERLSPMAPTCRLPARSRAISAKRCEEKSEPAAGDQCRILHRDPARCAGDPAAGLHADLRGGARGRLDRACAGAAAYRAADPAEFVICGGDAGGEARQEHIARRPA